jgi:outer membrane protein assembly factor BamB
MRLFAAILLTASLFASDWPRYRGPNGSGLSTDTGLPAEIGPEKSVIWKVKTLAGNSSPVVVRNRIFITGEDGDERFVLCYDAGTGKELWRKAVTRARNDAPHPLNGAATPSVATDGSSVFAFIPEWGLLAFSLDGKELWRVPLGPFGAVQGMATSPVYAEGKVMLLVDTPEQAWIAAYEAKSGKQAWKVERPMGFLGSYATPSLYKPSKGPAQLVVAGAVELTGYQIATGERVWWARNVTNAPAALPLVAGDVVYTLEPAGVAGPSYAQTIGPFDANKDGKIDIAAELAGEKPEHRIMNRLFRAIDKHNGNGDGVFTEDEYNAAFNPNAPGGGLVQVKLGGKGDVTATHVGWKHAKGLPYVTAALLYNDVLYVIRDGGILTTLDPATGKVTREDRVKEAIGQYYASPVAADGKVYLINKDGKASVLQAGADWKVLSTGDFAEQVIATPAIANSKLYVRTQSTLYCFGAS